MSLRLALILFFSTLPSRHALVASPSPELVDCLTKNLAATQQNTAILSGKFDQTRGINYMFGDLPGLKETLTALPGGAVVMDGGSGTGRAIGSAIDPVNLPIRQDDFTGTREAWITDAKLVEHLRFLGVTATSEADLVIPARGPRHAVLAGALFNHWKPEEIARVFGAKLSADYEYYGIFHYTSTPGEDLQLLHDVLVPGAPVFINTPNKGGVAAYFQLPSGEFINFSEFISRFGSSAYKIEPSDPKILKLTALPHDAPIGFPPVELVTSIGQKPPLDRYFRIIDPALTHEQRLRNDLVIWEKLRPRASFSNVINEYNPASSNFINASPEGKVEMLQKIESLYHPFSNEVIRQKDPFAYMKILSLHLLAGDVHGAEAYLQNNHGNFQTGTEFDSLFTGLLDLMKGRSDSPALRRLKDQSASSNRYPFTLKSFFGSVLAPNDKTYGFVLGPSDQSTPAVEQNPDFINSARDALELLRMAWRRNTEAEKWVHDRL